MAARLDLYQRAGGVITPVLTALFAFFVGGLVVLFTTGKNPIDTYKAIFNGTGLNWFFPWVRGQERFTAALNLQQTLIITTTLIFVGLAVAFAFRCGLFNIGGQGQYIAGMIAASRWSGDAGSAARSSHRARRRRRSPRGCSVGGNRRNPQGDGRRPRGDLDDHAQLDGALDRQLPGRVPGALQDPAQESVPVTKPIAEGAKLNVFWGDPILQGLHIGFFAAIGCLILFWVVLNRTTLGFEVRAVGFNPEAARYSGISVGRNYFLAMAISGPSPGLRAASTCSAGSSVST